MKAPPQNLPHYLRAWRLFRNLTLEHTANILNIKVNTLSDKELGKRPVNTEELSKLAEIYQCETWMLLAAAPESSDLEQLKRVREIMKKMSPKQTTAWLDIGDTLTESTR
jgi:transcriptional regulator with XRE-family HTH domain